MSDLTCPATVSEAIAMLKLDPHIRPLGGGTVVVPRLRAGRPVSGRWFSTSAIASLTEREVMRDGMVRLGSATTLRDIELDSQIGRAVPLLAEALRAVGGPALRNVATIGGSVASGPASPDPATALTAADAIVHVVSSVEGSGFTLLPRPMHGLAADGPTTGDGGFIVDVHVPSHGEAGWAYERLTVRGVADRPVVTVGVVINPMGSGTARVALGVVTGRIVRLRAVEDAVVMGSSLRAAVAAELAALHVADDDRASSTFRRRVAGVLVTRAVERAASLADAGTDP